MTEAEWWQHRKGSTRTMHIALTEHAEEIEYRPLHADTDGYWADLMRAAGQCSSMTYEFAPRGRGQPDVQALINEAAATLKRAADACKSRTWVVR